MTRGRLAAVLAAVTVLVAGLALVLARGDDEPPRVAVSQAEALRLALAEIAADTRNVLVVETAADAPSVQALKGLADRVLGSAIAAQGVLGATFEELGPLVGRYPIAIDLERRRAAFVADDPSQASDLGGRFRRKGPVVVVGEERRGAGLTPAAFARRTRGLDTRGAVARGTLDPARLPRFPGLRPTGVALALVPDDEGATVRLRLITDGPPLLAPGPQPPAPRGSAPLTVAVRDLATTLRAVRAQQPEGSELVRVDGLLRRFAGLDLQREVLDRLTGTTTITSRDGRTFGARGDLSEPDAVRDALDDLGRLGRLTGIAGLLGVDTGGLGIEDGPDGTRSITQDGRLLLTIGVVDDALVATNDPRASPKAIAQARPGRLLPPRGALHATVAKPLLQRELLARLDLPAIASLALEPLGDATLDARADDAGIGAELRIPVRRTP